MATAEVSIQSLVWRIRRAAALKRLLCGRRLEDDELDAVCAGAAPGPIAAERERQERLARRLERRQHCARLARHRVASLERERRKKAAAGVAPRGRGKGKSPWMYGAARAS